MPKEISDEEKLKKLSTELYKCLALKGRANAEELSDELGVSKLDVWEAAALIEKNRRDVKIVGDKKSDTIYMETAGAESLDLTPINRIVNKYKIGIVSDTMLGSKYQSLTPLYAAYKIFEKNDVDFIIHCGHLFAGKEDKARLGEMFIKDPDEQLDYAEKIYPRLEGVNTYVVSANRDRSFRAEKGFRDLVKELTERRNDLVYVGSDWKFPIADTDTMLRVMHPVDGAAPRGKSYGLQTTMEEIGNFLNTVDYGDIMKTGNTKNMVLVLGGYHTPIHIPNYTGLTAGLSMPSLYTQSPFLRKKRISPTIGAYMLEMSFDSDRKLTKDGIRATFFPLDRFIKKYDYYEEPENMGDLGDDDRRVLDMLRMEISLSYNELSRRLGLPKKTIVKSVSKLMSIYNTDEKARIVSPDKDVGSSKKGDGKDVKPAGTPGKRMDAIAQKKVIYYPEYANKFKCPEMDFKELFGREIKMLSLSDTHIGSKIDGDSIKRLVEAYEMAEKERCNFITHTGDVSDGTATAGYRGHENDARFNIVDDLVEELVRQYPSSKKVKTVMIAGNHDGWLWDKVGHDLVKHFAEQRKDIDYLGRLYQPYVHDGTKMLLIHGGGGTGYTLSQKPQNLLRYILEYDHDTKIVNIGNYHKAIFLGYSGKYIYLDSSTHSPTEFAKVFGLPEAIGFWIKKFTRDKDGRITSVTNTYINQR